MGIKKGTETLYQISLLTRADVAAITRGLYEEKRADNGFNMSQPTIDGDSNNICHVVAHKTCTKSMAVAEFYNDWANCGLNIVPICDGDIRPMCKQATNERRAERENNHIEAFLLLKEVNKIKSDIEN